MRLVVVARQELLQAVRELILVPPLLAVGRVRQEQARWLALQEMQVQLISLSEVEKFGLKKPN